MKKLKLCAVVLTELQHWTLFITKYIIKIKSLRMNQNCSFIKVKKVRKFKWSSIRLCYVISYSILLALFLQNFFDQTGNIVTALYSPSNWKRRQDFRQNFVPTWLVFFVKTHGQKVQKVWKIFHWINSHYSRNTFI